MVESENHTEYLPDMTTLFGLKSTYPIEVVKVVLEVGALVAGSHDDILECLIC